jgi:hypothetical protein
MLYQPGEVRASRNSSRDRCRANWARRCGRKLGAHPCDCPVHQPLPAISVGGALPVRSASRRQSGRGLDFARINRAALAVLPALLARWLPHGHRKGGEYVARNPTRHDCHLGSFRINMRTGRWADFATGDRGGDPISLAAYLSDLKQCEAAEKLASMLGVEAR